MLVFEPNCWPAFFDFGGKGTAFEWGKQKSGQERTGNIKKISHSK